MKAGRFFRPLSKTNTERSYSPTLSASPCSHGTHRVAAGVVASGDTSPLGSTRRQRAVNLYKPSLSRTMKSMDAQTKKFFTAEFEKLAASIAREFNRIGTRLDGIEGRLAAVEQRLASLEERATRLENRLGVVEGQLFELNERLESQMSFTSDVRDELSDRVAALEAKAA